MAASGSTGFSLNSSEEGFKSRCTDVFGGLETLEKKHDAFTAVQSRSDSKEDRRSLVKPDPREDPVQPGSRSSFRSPRGRARRSRYMPDFKKNPEKWTSYDLSTVTNDQLSERGNTAAAFQFLQERRKARESGEDSAPADLTQKVTFSHKSKCEGQDKEQISEKKYQSGKLVMPEYDIGQKSVKPKSRKTAEPKLLSTSDSGSVNLDYLQEEEYNDVTMVQNKGETSSESSRKRKADDDLAELGSNGKQVKTETEIQLKRTEKDSPHEEHTNPGSSDSVEVKFRKVSGKKSFRRRAMDEDENE